MHHSLKEQRVAAYFHQIAPNYDLVNSLISFGLHHNWRRFTVEKADLRPGQRVLDVCCGTGLITKDLAQQVGPQGNVVGLDIAPAMLTIASQNLQKFPWRHTIRFVEGNAMALPFGNESFDRAIIGYGLRNVSDMRQALRELFRVLKPGGKVVSLELAKPKYPIFFKLYHWYTSTLMPLIGFLIAGEKEPYLYLHRSVQDYPHQHEVTRIFSEIGFTGAHCYELNWGIVAVHVGTKPH